MNIKKMNTCTFPIGEPNTAYAQYFIGNSYLASIQPANLAEGEKTVAPYANVTFEPGCRNNWHVHHGAHQILICVSGRGWYQEWGKVPIALQPGMIIDIPDEVKHWHGAQKDSWFQHLTTHVATVGEQSKAASKREQSQAGLNSAEREQARTEFNEWLESVSDDHYNNLK